jgi:hypothetical protein
MVHSSKNARVRLQNVFCSKSHSNCNAFHEVENPSFSEKLVMLGTIQSGAGVMKCQQKVAFGLLVVRNTAEVLGHVEATQTTQNVWGIPA